MRTFQFSGFAYVQPEGMGGVEGIDGLGGCEVEVKVDDGEDPCAGDEGENVRADDVEAAEGEKPVLGGGVAFGVACGLVCPACEPHFFVPTQHAAAGAVHDSQGGEGFSAEMGLKEVVGVEVAEDVDVAEKDGGGALEKGLGFEEATPCIEEQIPLVGDVDVEVSGGVAAEEVLDHVCIVVDIYDDVCEAEVLETAELDGKEWGAINLGEGFGAVVGVGAQAGAEACREDHGFHGRGLCHCFLSCSMCWRSMVTPYFLRRWAASWSAL